MFEAVMTQISTIDIFIATAAVADYRPIQQAAQKIKKNQPQLQWILERTPDILAAVANLPSPPFTVGFAAETENLVEYARTKLEKKKLDMIAANPVNVEGIGFDSEENALMVFWGGGSLELPRCSKNNLAKQLIEIIVQRYRLKSQS
jgi:phosphopantothenoylcysteine decarboxylase/phosphopantothenate--cysteine ligase